MDGVDHRVRWTYSSSDWPRDTMGALIYSDGTVGCTATLFSSQLVATAAHCIFGCNNTLNLPSKFAAGMDGTTIPYTEESINGYWYQTAYRTNNCNACTVNSTCTPYDIAFLSLGGRIGQTTGWMGWYWASSDSTVAGWTQFNMGYPECSQCGAPSGCVQNSMWGDWGSCGMGSFFDPVNGVNRNYKFGCDTSAGHSGGPLYTWAPNGCSSFPCIVGIDLAQDCCGSACSNTASTPNTAYRIVQTDSNVMASLQSMFP